LFLADEDNDTSTTSRTEKVTSSVRDFVRKTKKKYLTKTDPNDSPRSDTQLKNIFHQYSRDDEVNVAIFFNTLKLEIVFIF